MRYAIVIEKGEKNFCAYVPDLPGSVSVGDTLEEVTAEIREAIEFHLEGMRQDGSRIPTPFELGGLRGGGRAGGVTKPRRLLGQAQATARNKHFNPTFAVQPARPSGETERVRRR